MGLRLREAILACSLAIVLSLSLVAGVFADRGGNGDSGRGHRTPTVVSQLGNGHGGGRQQASSHQSFGGGHQIDSRPAGSQDSDDADANEDDVASTPTATPSVETTGTATPEVTGTTTPEACDNHGEEVSEVAHSAPRGPEHGKEVSAAARDKSCVPGGENDTDETPTVTVTTTPSGSETPTATATATPVATGTQTATATATPTATETATATATATPSGSETPTATATSTSTAGGTGGTSSTTNNTLVVVIGKVFHSIVQIFASF